MIHGTPAPKMMLWLRCSRCMAKFSRLDSDVAPNPRQCWECQGSPGSVAPPRAGLLALGEAFAAGVGVTPRGVV